jgi:clan AA aspartic protease (TIGR02281 family)
MKKVLLLVGLVISNFVFPAGLLGGENYLIGKDKGGLYMETDSDGSWYIDPQSLKLFRLGEKGKYSIGRDKSGTFIRTDKHGTFYVDVDAQQNIEQEREKFNEREKQAQEIETNVVVEGNHVFVPALLGYGGNETEALLLLDTGASVVVLHHEITEQLNLTKTQKAKLTIAGGKAIDADIVKLDYVKVGPLIERNIHASVIRHEGPPVKYNGLLGMNFLQHCEYRIDYKKKVIKWKKSR